MRNNQKDSPFYHRRSSSPENIHEVQKERSREKGSKVQYYMGPDLHLTKHYYFMVKQQKRMSTAIAVWNLCMLYGKRPALCLILCENQSQIYKIMQFNKLNRKTAILADHDRRSLKLFVQKQQVEIVLMTNKKASMLCALEQSISSFGVVINLAFHKDIEHYRKLHEFIQKTGGITVSFVSERRDLQKIQRATGLNFLQTTAEISSDDINKQIMGDIQFVSTPKPETYSLIKMLPFSCQELCARMFQILQQNTSDNIKSKYLGLPGYLTYQIKTQVQFNSYKYVWNFLKDLPQQLTENVKNMTKFKNGKGAVFNIPVQYRYEMDHYIRKLVKNNKDNKFQISIAYQLPEIQDIDSLEYKQLEEKKNFAMKNKKDLQVFVGGLPLKVGEPQIRSFFLKNNVNPLTIRLMRDKEGFSKGICFILCEDKEHVSRALKLDESKFDDKIIRVHIAQKRQNRWDH